MPRFTVKCETCGKEEEKFLPGGEHPPCSGCQSNTIYVWRATGASHGIVTDEAFIGGMVIENLGHEPVTVYSRQDLARKMQAAGVEQRIKYVPGDKHLSNWGNSIDPYTLEAARVLVSRPGARSIPDPGPRLKVQITTRIIPNENAPADKLDH